MTKGVKEKFILIFFLLVGLPMLKSESRNPLAVVSGQYSITIYLEIGMYGVLFIAISYIAMRYQIDLFGNKRLFALPIYLSMTAIWSHTHLLSFVRSLQLLILFLFINMCLRLFQNDELKILYIVTANFFIALNLFLLIICFVNPTYSSGDRLTYLNVHPIVSATLAGLSTIHLMLDRYWGTKHIRQICLVFPNLVFLWLNQSRGPLLAMLFTFAMAILISRDMSMFKKFAYSILTISCALLIFGYRVESLKNYISRGEDFTQLNRLNGRVYLWNQITEHISLLQIIFGHGYGAERVTAFDAARWAGSTHNSWLSFYYGGGCIALFFLVYLLLRALRASQMKADFSSMLYPIVFLSICGLSADTFQFPQLFSLQFFLLIFLAKHQIKISS